MPKMKMRPKILRTGLKRGDGDGAFMESSKREQQGMVVGCPA